MSMSPELKQRIFAQVSGEKSPTRSELVRVRIWLMGCGVVGAVAIFWLEGGMRVASRPPSLVALTSLGTALVAGLGIWILMTRGRSLLGRPSLALVMTAVVSAALFVAWRYGVSALYGKIDPWPTRTGFRCLGLSVATGALPLLGALLSWRRQIPVSPIATGAAFGAGAGLGSALLVDLWCPVSFLPHLLIGHVAPIVILALVGGALGSRILRIFKL